MTSFYNLSKADPASCVRLGCEKGREDGLMVTLGIRETQRRSVGEMRGRKGFRAIPLVKSSSPLTRS